MTRPGAAARRWAPPTAFFLLLAAVVALYAADPDGTSRLLRGWILRPYGHPFLDWQWLSRSVECWRRGIDVFTNNPCPEPVFAVRFTLSPLWLRLPLPVGDRWVTPVGLGLCVLFGLALAALPAAPDRRGAVLVTLTAVSSAAAFALERANVDVILFVLLVAATRLWQGRLPLRLLAYALILFAGLLKFYPLAALVLCGRERPGIALLVGLLAASIAAALGLAYGAELAASLRNLPSVWYFGDGFGAANGPLGLAAIAEALGDPAVAEAMGVVKPALVPCFALGAWVAAARLAERARLAHQLAALGPSLLGPLVAGSALVVGCFFAGQSIGYRAIFLLPALPGALALAVAGPAGRAFRTTSLAVVFVSWTPALQAGLAAIGPSGETLEAVPGGLALWLLKELAWWWIAVTLGAVLIGFLRGTELAAPFRRGPAGPGAGGFKPRSCKPALRPAEQPALDGAERGA